MLWIKYKTYLWRVFNQEAMLKISATLRRWTRLNARLVLNDHRLLDQNKIASVWLSWYAVTKATQGLTKVQEKLKTWQRYISALTATRSYDKHRHAIANVFCHCVKMLLGCFDYIVIFLCKVLAPLSGFGFILCRKKRQLKCYNYCFYS